MMTDEQEQPKERLNLSYRNDSDRYRYGEEDIYKFHKRQFIFVYRSRIEMLKGKIVDNARKVLGNPTLSETIIDNQENEEVIQHKDVLIIGVVFKKMKLRQSILYEFSDDSNFHMQFSKDADENLTDEGDSLELELSQQVIKLIGKINKHDFVTGDIIGVFGSQEDETNLFNVTKVLFPEMPQQIPWPTFKEDYYVAFISGISLPGDKVKSPKTCLALSAFQKWINGEIIPSDDKEKEILRRIVRLVIAGDFCKMDKIGLHQQKIAGIGLEYDVDLESLNQFDRFLVRCLQNLPIDLIPGVNDPAQCSIPQQPIPKVVFDGGVKFNKMLHTVTNPYNFSLAGLQFLGTSGQNVNDLARLTRGMNSLERMERTLRMSHVFPTVPDTLNGFPFQLRDPLVLEQLPHIYFCGNQRSFEKKSVDLEGKRCLLLAVPKFCETFEVILLNLRNLDAIPYKFDMNLDFASPE